MKKILILLTAIFSLAVFIAGYGAELDRQSMLAESTAAELKRWMKNMIVNGICSSKVLMTGQIRLCLCLNRFPEISR